MIFRSSPQRFACQDGSSRPPRPERYQRQSFLYPRKGSLVDLTTDFFDPAFGGDRSYQNLTTSYDKYLGVGAKNVFAIHGTVCMVTNQGPFWDICELGMSKDLRGYQIGQFRDNRMVVGQAEYRRELFWRLGAVAFAGAGAVGKTFSQFGKCRAWRRIWPPGYLGKAKSHQFTC